MVQIFKRDEDANVVELGAVQVTAGQVEFEGFEDTPGLVEWLKRGIRVGGKELKPTDGVTFVRALPRYLHGSRLWAARLEAVEKGGPGSGHHGHKGRKGKRGGSARSKAAGLAKLSAPTGDVGTSGNKGMNEWLNASTDYVPTDQTVEAWEASDDGDRAKLKAQVARDLAEASGVSEQEAADFVSQWAHSSNDDDMRSLAIQEDAAKEFGLKTSEFTQQKIAKVEEDRKSLLPLAQEKLTKVTDDPWLQQETWRQMEAPYRPLMESNKQRAILRSMYNETQAELKSRGIKEVRLYRGVKLDKGAAFEKGESRSIDTNAIESWSVSQGVATTFARGANESQIGVVFEAVVPAGRVLSAPSTGFGCLTEGEVVVLGGVQGDEGLVSSVYDPIAWAAGVYD